MQLQISGQVNLEIEQYNKIMNKHQSYNIITGEIKNNYPVNSTSQRFASHIEIKRAKQKGEYIMPMGQRRRLGTSSDSKNYIYSHISPIDSANTLQNNRLTSTSFPERTSLINATKLLYNPINHSQVDSATIPKWNTTNKLGPLSKETHLGRLNAANYSKEYAQKLANNTQDFHRKKSACTELCHIQKSYGVDKFFRKFK